MVVYAVKRILQLIPVLLGISVLVFLLLHLIPGDPAIVLLGQDATPQDVARLRSALGLDQPVWVQLEKFLVRLVQGDLGRSIFQQEKVSDLVLRHIPATIELTLAAMLVAVLIAVPMGIISAVRQYSVFDYGTMIFA
ncbi:MAG: ABC transporter permease, partial [Actinobacteria bacterium]|nr:ABC transporter permease [Actinomycetota bacterium]